MAKKQHCAKMPAGLACQHMSPRPPQIFGTRFVVHEVEDLELLTDLLSASRDHLNIVFAIASYLERVPNGSRHFRPILQNRIQNSVEQLRRHSAARNSEPLLPQASH